MSVSPVLLDNDGWTQVTDLLRARQANLQIASNIIDHLRALGARTVLIENEYIDRDFTEAFAAYYARLFKRHTKLCKRLHFFSSDLSAVMSIAEPKRMAAELQAQSASYLGYVTLRPIHEAPLAQALLMVPDPPAAYESHTLVRANYKTHVLGAEFSIRGLPMTQQDQRIGACAQASIWSASRHFHAQHNGAWVSTVGITEAAMQRESESVAATIPNGSEFLSLNGMVTALRAVGRKPLTYLAVMSGTPPKFTWQGLRPEDVINRYVDSGIPVIVGLGNLGGDIGHAVVASGQLLNLAPPQGALPQRPTRAAYCSAFYVNDDQGGPNLRMPIEAGSAIGETTYNVRNNVLFLLIPLPDKVFLPAEKAEAFAWDLLDTYSLAWNGLKAAHTPHLGNSIRLGDEFTGRLAANEVIARTYLTYGWKYKFRLLRNDLTNATLSLARATDFPRYVWVTEFGTRESFSPPDKYQRRIFAHCVVDATAKNMGDDSRLFFHAPGVTISRVHNPDDPNGPYKQNTAIVADDRPYFPKLRGNQMFEGY